MTLAINALVFGMLLILSKYFWFFESTYVIYCSFGMLLCTILKLTTIHEFNVITQVAAFFVDWMMLYGMLLLAISLRHKFQRK